MSVQSAGEGAGSTFTMDMPIWTSSNTEHHATVKRIMTKETLEALQSYSRECITDTADYSRESVRRACSVLPCDDEIAGVWLQNNRSEITNIPNTSSLNVLVVDDVSLNRKMLCRSISSNFNHIAQARDGEEAIRYAMNGGYRRPHIILMDYVMPNMDGPTATKELRALGYKGMIIGVTGNALPADVDIFLSAGATCVLTKPFRPEELYAAIAGMSVHIKLISNQTYHFSILTQLSSILNMLYQDPWKGSKYRMYTINSFFVVLKFFYLLNIYFALRSSIR